MRCRILLLESIAPRIHQLVVHAPLIAKKARPGQFVILRADARGERIPLTLCDWSSRDGWVKMIFQEVGVTTKKLASLKPGEFVEDIVGPLGTPAEIAQYGTVCVVGGGVGAAAAYPRAKSLKQAGNEVVAIIGARSSEYVILEESFKGVCDELFIATDDGSRGFKGFVSQLLEKLLEEGKRFNYVFAAGPVPMMRAVAEVTKPYGIKTVVSLNPIMVDGTGMCGSCRVTVGGVRRFCCVDGPEFDAHQVDFSELMSRLSMYVEEEGRALALYEGASFDEG